MQVIDLGTFERTETPDDGSFEQRISEPFTMCFVYTPKGNFLIKGMCRDVNKKLKEFPVCVYYQSFWLRGKSRGYWRSNIKGILIFGSLLINGREKKRVRLMNSKGEQKEMFFRRIPRKWLPEYEFALS